MIPEPKALRRQSGAYLLPANAGMKIDEAFLDTHAGIRSLLPMLAESGRAVCFEQDADLDEPCYRIVCDEAGARVRAAGPLGALYGAATLRQMLEDGALPFCTLEDTPAFSWRGLHLDVCRHFFPVSTVRSLVDLLALYKMNRLHLHLSDDQGFRVESERFPLLNAIGSWRRSSAVKRGHGEEQDGLPHGGFYTKAELREMVDYAHARGVEIVPELDLPGHAGAILAAYPELACFPHPAEVQTRYGVRDFSAHILCAGNEAAFDFLFALIDEISELFPFSCFHIGGDEAVKTAWRQCPKCQARMRELGLKTERELQGWFSWRLMEHLKTLRKRAIVWNDGLTPLLTLEAVCQHWTPPAIEGDARTRAHLAAGGQAIMSGFRSLYFDYPYAMTPLEKTYRYHPWPKGLGAKERDGVLGVECCLWTEWIRDEEKLFYNLLPRLCAVSELGWRGTGGDYHGFTARLERQYALFAEMGLPYAAGKERADGPLSRLCTTRRFFFQDADIELRDEMKHGQSV